MTEYIVTLKDRLKRIQERRKQTMVLPSKRSDVLGRRKGLPLIRFYDLGQVNHQALDAAAVWVDHPTLKTPSYSTAANVSAADFFQGVNYFIDPFADADYQAFTDLMFAYPVTEWTQRYRRVEFPTSFLDSLSYTTDARISLTDGSADEIFLGDLEISTAWPVDYPTVKESYLTSNHWAYSVDRQGAFRRGLTSLIMNNQALTGTESVTSGYFPCNTFDKVNFKVTATNNSAAADVGTLALSGAIDVFMMPQLGLSLATSNSSDWKTTEVLGLCYQVMPRHLWPLYVTPGATGTGSQWGSDADVDNYISYLTSRSQYSVWSFTGAINTPFDYSYSEGPSSAGDWTGQSSWAFGCNGGIANSYYGMTARSGPNNDSRTAYSTAVFANSTDSYYGSLDLFRNYSPFLSCVFKMGGQFYYVWDISGGASGNYTADETTAQSIRYRINRNVLWNGTTISTRPTPRDGSGVSWDVQNDFP